MALPGPGSRQKIEDSARLQDRPDGIIPSPIDVVGGLLGKSPEETDLLERQTGLTADTYSGRSHAFNAIDSVGRQFDNVPGGGTGDEIAQASSGAVRDAQRSIEDAVGNAVPEGNLLPEGKIAALLLLLVAAYAFFGGVGEGIAS